MPLRTPLVQTIQFLRDKQGGERKVSLLVFYVLLSEIIQQASK